MVNWAYVAGFFDGEGNINVAKHRISIYQNDIRPLNAIKEFFAKNGIVTYVYTRPTPRRTNFDVKDTCSVLRFCGQPDVKKFLRGVLPYLIVKKQDCEDTLRFLTIYPAFNAKTIGQLGRERSSSKFGLGLHAGIARDEVTGRFVPVAPTCDFY